MLPWSRTLLGQLRVDENARTVTGEQPERAGLRLLQEPLSSDPPSGLARVADVLRSRWWVVACVLAVAISTALIVLPTLPKTYEARATLLIEPLPNDDQASIGLGLPRQSSDPTRDVETVSQLIVTSNVARRVRTALDLKTPARKLLQRVDSVPVAQSNVVAITARADSPQGAKRLANAFARAALAERTSRLQQELDQLIPRLQRQVAGLPNKQGVSAQALQSELQELLTLRGGPDPTVHIAALADVPASPVSPRRGLVLAATVLGGLIFGIVFVLGAEAAAPRIQREEDLQRYRAPIVTRVPIERSHGRRATRTPLVPGASTFAVADAYQLLGAAVAASPLPPSAAGRVVVVTAPTPSSGKTTTALHLATALPSRDRRVLLVDADTRHPQVATALGIEPGKGLEAVIDGTSSVLAAANRFPGAENVRVLTPKSQEASGRQVFTPDSTSRLLLDAQASFDWVICDTPPPTYVPDGLTLARQADLLIVVVRLRTTSQRDLAELAELLVQQRVTPFGFVVVGGKRRQPYLIDPGATARTL